MKLFLAQKYARLSQNQKYNFAKNNYGHLSNIRLLKHFEGDSASIDLLVEMTVNSVIIIIIILLLLLSLLLLTLFTAEKNYSHYTEK